MDGRVFWDALAARINSELAQFEGTFYRSLYCDGLIPEDVEHRDRGVCITGRAWMMGPFPGQEKWEYTLLLGESGCTRRTAEWETLLPTEDETEWLAVREWGLEIVPPAAERSLLSDGKGDEE